MGRKRWPRKARRPKPRRRRRAGRESCCSSWAWSSSWPAARGRHGTCGCCPARRPRRRIRWWSRSRRSARSSPSSRSSPTRVPDEFTARQAQVRDLLLTLFTSKQFAEIRTPQGKALLRDEIINRINRAINHDLVKAVYFTEFIVQ
ncbi:MAG: flagellar basal body-associated FliL family protein [Deltaproteobacteria bacterium]|nr:MAG: flagellar basal body-associated FliL family protein [Deltaproteobacteria bacterium]